MFTALRNRSGLQMSTILLTVKFSSSCSCPVEVDIDSSILDVKSTLSKQLQIPTDEIQIILAGRVLEDKSTIKDLCISNCSVLHAFQQKQPEIDIKLREGAVGGDTSTTFRKVEPYYQYFVYCKKCQCLQPGKLRVRCQACNDGYIILSRDPENFDDVLQSGRIQGECKSEQCNGQQREANFFFKCTGHRSEEGDTAAVLKHTRPNRKRRACIVCSDIGSPVMVFPCERHHVICLDCFKSYGVVRLNDRSFTEDENIGYSLPCPVGCRNSLLEDAHHFCLLGVDQYERYKNFATEEYVLQNGGVLCPAVGCGAGFLLAEVSRKVTCPTCQYTFCGECKLEYHEDPDCQALVIQESSSQNYIVSEEQELRARWNLESLETIGRISKPCPNCKTNTEKAGGCMHMSCSRCYFEWCWMCEKEWTRDCQGNHWFG
ncbi:E3 ubiquitin-protein ligase parkin-like [Ylistrum balloti]|uniref:E3 ubiquitin-protein ligase parkin-like n=1 Tax=Ylistrum balloti TaxID=509963 RepID=UPI00290592A7|nr:E3 ubiquitin-protein ligase parkin-like [Ylistrum balloti]XP_060083945.1 E3 ubiquitin-protein ligase parkin-like [Ylistrum balloti]XP_060083946.1 E3 ubiquitin-protein ligase parkin-like [Ylistrum balloti]